MKSPKARLILVTLAAVCAVALAVPFVSAADLTVGRQTPNTSFGTRSMPVTLAVESKAGDVCNPCTVAAYSYTVITAREAGSGMATGREAGSGIATGRRQYEPLKITKRLDKSSPLLYRAMAFTKILYTHVPSKTMAEDSWTSSR